jgi:hypothetical protein
LRLFVENNFSFWRACLPGSGSRLWRQEEQFSRLVLWRVMDENANEIGRSADGLGGPVFHALHAARRIDFLAIMQNQQRRAA